MNTIEQETLIITRSRYIGGFQTAEDVINRLSENIQIHIQELLVWTRVTQLKQHYSRMATRDLIILRQGQG